MWAVGAHYESVPASAERVPASLWKKTAANSLRWRGAALADLARAEIDRWPSTSDELPLSAHTWRLRRAAARA